MKQLKSISALSLISNLIRLLLVLSMFLCFISENYFNMFLGTVTLFLTYLPFIIAKKNHIILPSIFQIIILLFIFAANYLGELNQFYEKFWWWDIMLHTLSGIIIGFIGFMLIYILNKEKKVNVNLSPGFMVLFAFCFAVSMGALWEIYEFSVDSLFGLHTQNGSLVDTMTDLIVDTLGALLASFYGYMYEKYRKNNFFRRFIILFLRDNPDLPKDEANM